ncbi:uncharacterized protein LOC117590021 [Drosophila guanche]|uniref:Blast:snRNA-activating protein complex subunit 4 n=2 Tax=Drosophila guanche TaxID=7266 RepID=A0A3B0KNU2_DROGU|nr:uncharacterized protein LOC117590021 [Drosophila guanche]SPP88279.1 blast:snRNA-activating protein complex subunit 4 [Drosophila guanche]
MDVENLSNLNPNQLLAEITPLLEATSDPSESNALVLNHELQRRLHQVRAKVLALLNSVRARYALNEEILIRRLKPRTHSLSRPTKGSTETYGICGAIRRGATFHFKGNLYFRDIDGRSCPNNGDYDVRSYTEMFPADFDMRSKHVWTVLDKKNLIMGIKQQLLDHEACEKPTNKNALKRRPIERHVRSLASLLVNADSSFSIDWNQISTLDLEFRHSNYSCEAMWRVYLHPKLSREDWSASEDAALVAAAKANLMQNWGKVASALGRRSDYQCFVRVQIAFRQHLEPSSSVRWTEKDSETLKRLVEKNTVNGQVNWQLVSEHFPGRSKSTLIGRYTYALHPSISHAPFSTTEDIMLFAAVEEYNGKFPSFPRTLFPNRSLAQLRTRYHNVLAQRTKTDPWSVVDDTKLMNFVTEHGAAQWVNCATHLGNHTRTSCRTRFLVIKRFLEQNPLATVEDCPRRRCFKNNIVTAENWAECLEVWQQDPESIDPSKPKTRPPRPAARRISNIKGEASESNGHVAYPKEIDLQVYEYFKYSYDLQLKTSPSSKLFSMPNDGSNLAYVVKVLNYQPPAAKSLKPIQSVSMPLQLSMFYNQMLKTWPNKRDKQASHGALLLPPNFSTMMGFRAICIVSGDSRKIPSDEPPSYDESSQHIQQFRKRLRALFYRTTLLSRLETHLFDDLPSHLVSLPRPLAIYIESGARPTQEEPAAPQMSHVNRGVEPNRKKPKLEPLSEDELMSFKEEEEFLSL